LNESESTLIDAYIDGELSTVKQLVKKNNVDVNIQTVSGKTPLMCATIMGNTEVTKYLVVEKKADLYLLEKNN